MLKLLSTLKCCFVFLLGTFLFWYIPVPVNGHVVWDFCAEQPLTVPPSDCGQLSVPDKIWQTSYLSCLRVVALFFVVHAPNQGSHLVIFSLHITHTKQACYSNVIKHYLNWRGRISRQFSPQFFLHVSVERQSVSCESWIWEYNLFWNPLLISLISPIRLSR